MANDQRSSNRHAALAWGLCVALAACSPVKFSGTGDAATDDADPSGVDAPSGPACGVRGKACCAMSMCDTRSTCDGTACIAIDVWASAADGVSNFGGGTWSHPLLIGSTAQVPPVNHVWGTTSNFVVGVGAAGVILRRDSAGWHRDVPARADGTGTLYGVAGASASDVWAVGETHFVHYNGASWLDVTPPNSNGEAFLSVWMSGPGEGWATGVSGITSRLTAGTWSAITRQGNGYDKNAVWGTAANDVWKVGERKSLATGLIAEIQHFDGTSWTSATINSAGDLPVLRAVWGSDARHVWAVGDGGTIVFWDGALWKPILSGTSADLTAVWGSGPADVWVASAAGMRHYNGTTWAPVGTLTSPPVTVWLSQD